MVGGDFPRMLEMAQNDIVKAQEIIKNHEDGEKREELIQNLRSAKNLVASVLSNYSK